MQILLMRLEAPMISFGSILVDNLGKIQNYPAASMITGLLANALGLNHTDWPRIQALQTALTFAVRCERKGLHITDYQTVNLGQDHLVDTGWTTGGKPEGRAGASSKQTHQRYREYWTDAVYLLALTLNPSFEVSMVQLKEALRFPARPLFIGRKNCLPTEPLFKELTSEYSSLKEALQKYPRLFKCGKKSEKKTTVAEKNEPLQAWWPADADEGENIRVIPVTDERDWRNQVHVGRRMLFEGMVDPPQGGVYG